MSIVSVAKKPAEAQFLQWTGDNRDELLSFAGEALAFGEGETPVIESLGEGGFMQQGDLLMKNSDGVLSIMGPDQFIKSFAVESIEGLQATIEKHWNKAEREAASSSDWAVPHKKKLRIDDAKHVKLAWDMVTRVKDLTDEERASARRRILAKAKKLGVETSTWSKESITQEDIDAEIVVMDAARPVIPAPVGVFSYLLTHVAEEASELVWAACKVQRYGFDTVCPQTGKINRDKMCQELSELLACLEILNEELEGAGMEPVVASAALIQESKQTRLATLQMEHGLGRFITGAEG